MSTLEETGGINGARAPSLKLWQPWITVATAAFALHFTWEMLQAPLYVGMTGLRFGEGTRICAVASLGDVVLALTAYGAVAAFAGRRAWLLRPTPGNIAAYLVLGLAVTAAIELLAVYRIGRWSYGPAMPRVAGIGLAPLLQWVVVPVLTLWVARRYLEYTARRTRFGEHHG